MKRIIKKLQYGKKAFYMDPVKKIFAATSSFGGYRKIDTETFFG